MKRESFFSLDGDWEYAITRSETPPDVYDGVIRVPYSPESVLSGVNRALRKDEFLHYRRIFELPRGFRKRKVLLNVGACDQVCTVFLNSVPVGCHEGGYLPFSFDLTPCLCEGKNELCFTVTDNADSDVYGRGKQRYRRGGIWYTAVSGIWQSVWLESVPEVYTEELRLLPDFDRKTLTIEFKPAVHARAEVFEGTRPISVGEGEGKIELDVSLCKPWTPERPELYVVQFTLGEDRVTTYFGLRKFSLVERSGKRFFALNNEPVFMNGLLDQGYWSGIYTPRPGEMLECLSKVKAAGFNMLRKHLKIEPLVWYYYCDVLGILVWQDMPNGGAQYKQWRINLGPFVDLRLNDADYRSMGRENPLSRAQYMKEAIGTVSALFNCVSVCLYAPFNEGWGQFDAVKVSEILKELDPGRFYDHASGWQDMGGGDVCSKHVYFRKVKLKNDGKRALALTEFGGYAFSERAPKKAFGYKKIGSRAQFEAAVSSLFRGEILPLVEREGLCATVYTQLKDVEDEVNGLMTEEGRWKVDPALLKALGEELFAAFSKAQKTIAENGDL